MLAAVAAFLLRRRRGGELVLLAAALAGCYVALTFDLKFLITSAPFWKNPVGPWLMDATDTTLNVDMAAVLGGYYAYVHAPSTFPLFLIPSLGPPPGTSGVFLDFIPLVALTGKLASIGTGTLINPYGAWIIAAFVLTAVFATLVLIEAGEGNLLGCAIASVLAISAPPLLHRFGHLAFFGQFVVIAALWLYLRDRHSDAWRVVAIRWSILLFLTLLINAYLFAMVGAIYTAAWIDHRWVTASSRKFRWRELAFVATPVVIALLVAGYVGRGTDMPFSDGFGTFSMNLASPFWPQRSGLFPGMWPIVDATGGQYEGFNYLGAGGLLLLGLALIRDFKAVLERARAHPGFVVICTACVVFALSNRMYWFQHLVLQYQIPPQLHFVLGSFRSTGRFFWPVFYTILLGGLALALRHGKPGTKVGIVVLVCALQLVDTEPLRARITELTRGQAPMVIERDEWIARLDDAKAMIVVPPYNCTNEEEINVELGLLASLRNRPTNTVYNPRGRPDCAAEIAAVRNGPWRNDILYVVLADVGIGFSPPKLHCESFRFGTWCLGSDQGN
jgi:hypothetical protein